MSQHVHWILVQGIPIRVKTGTSPAPVVGRSASPADHGTVQRYHLSCRCDLCRAAMRDYHRERRRLKALKEAS